MRLLDKKQVTLSKAVERQAEIEQGVQLAKKVDALREAVSIETANLERFRTQAVSRVKEEVASWIEKKQSIQSDVDSLKEEKWLLGTIVEREWSNVKGNKRLDEVEKLKKILTSKIDSLRQAENEMDERLDSVRNEEQRVDLIRQEALKLSTQAQIETQQSEKLALEIKERNISTMTVLEERTVAVLRKENDINARERDTDSKLAIVRAKDADLIERERALADKYATLQRTIDRYSKLKK